MFVRTITGYLESLQFVFFIRCILVLITCLVAAFNSQFARPAPRHSSSTRAGCTVNGLLFKMATLVLRRQQQQQQQRPHEDSRLHGVGRHLPSASLHLHTRFTKTITFTGKMLRCHYHSSKALYHYCVVTLSLFTL